MTDSVAVRQTRQNTSLFFQHTSQSNFVTDFSIERRLVPQVAPQASKKAFPADCTRGKKAFTSPQARGLLPYHRQESFCRTTGKRASGAFAAPQARWFGGPQRANNILAAPDNIIFPSHR